MAAAIPDVLRSIAFGSISGTYTKVGTPISYNWRMFRLINDTDGDMFVSVDGVNNNYFVPANSFVLYDLACNSAPAQQSDGFVLAIGTQFWIKQSTAATQKAVYIEGLYARGY
jgi:hypothetical protein